MWDNISGIDVSDVLAAWILDWRRQWRVIGDSLDDRWVGLKQVLLRRSI